MNGTVGDVGSRIARIEAALAAAFAPSELEVVDDSHLHAGHAGAREGKGHFRVRLTAPAFAGRSLLERHRLVYAALAPLLASDIHALGIDARAPEE